MPAASLASRSSRTLWGDAWHRLRRNKLAMAGLVWVFIMIIVAVSADLWVPQRYGDPEYIDTTTVSQRMLLAPSAQHPFGTDRLGRDIFARVVYGSRISLAVGVIAVSIEVIIGLVLGALAAYYGKLWDSIIMRIADVFLAFPYILFAIALIAVLGKGFINVFIAIGILGWPSIARVFRGSILSVKENEYVDAARALGASDLRIMMRHIMPNAIAPIIVYGTMSIGGAILTEAALSFLGMGVQPPTPSWGLMLSEARAFMFTAPWIMIYPGFAILTTVLAFVLLGDGLRDALDVKMKD
ncbi:ABC transporter permease [Coriobacteriia bacterium Es71-Z0120]|uniref:ABC transporter permease n=1 Tax=Parvivirga hydrogeniphila TaxID=2939460 RepID=UPI002260C23F|nr:ABC transporter permease [Parvivirga hydrogeniphila]